MANHGKKALKELEVWQGDMLKQPSSMNQLAKNLQNKINSFIPERIHQLVTSAIKYMVKATLIGSAVTQFKSEKFPTLEETEKAVKEKVKYYVSAAAWEGGFTGAGGFLLSLVDFPWWMSIKIKMLFEIASLYGFDTKLHSERIYILYIFQLAFSSHEHQRKMYMKIENWEKESASLGDVDDFDWRSFQQEYRDNIDMAKLAQMLPLVGAPVGFIVNYRLTKKLARTAMNAYRMRLDVF